MIHRAWYVSGLGTVLLAAGCSSTAQLETRSYPLQRRAAEEPVIKVVLDEEFARVGAAKMGAATALTTAR